MVLYSIKDGFKINKKFAQPAGEIMAQLEAEGKLTAEELVNVSRPEEAPLHDYFEWDDAIAAEKYRERQGVYLIQAVIEIDQKQTKSDNTVEVEIKKPFYSVEQGDKHYYHIDTIVQDEDKSQKLFEMCVRELKQIERRYEIIRDKLSGVFEEIDKISNYI